MISGQTRDVTDSQIGGRKSLNTPSLGAPSVANVINDRFVFWLTIGLYGSMILLTRPLSFADSIFYVQAILAFRQHPDPVTTRLLLDFGHVLWRPLGWLVFKMVRVLFPVTSSGDDRVLVLRILICISMISGAVATAMLHLICRDRGFRPWVRVLLCATFIFSNAVIYATQIGSSYMLGLAFLTAATWLVMRPSGKTKKHGRDLSWAGILLALSAAAWFPFVLVAPAVAVAAAIPWNISERSSIGSVSIARALHVIGAGVVGGTTIFGAAAWALHIKSLAGIRTWVSGSAHGWRQTSNLLRMGMGLPRCCVALKDNAGVVWKRFLFHDPFAPVKLHDLLQINLLLMAAFYFGFALLLYTLARSNRGRILLFLLTIAALPVLYFAIFLFEPSSVERFMPVFPFYFVALGCQFDFIWPDVKLRSLALIYPVVLIVCSLAIYNNSSVRRYWEPARMRLEALTQELPAGSTVALLGNWDEVFLFSKDNPLHDTFSQSLDLWVVLQPANERIFGWRELFARRALQAWEGSSEMWVSERLLSEVPRPEWDWVEGDDPAIHWSQAPEFYHQFQFDKRIGDSDGFVRLAPSESNRTLLRCLATQACEPQAGVQ